MADSPSNDEIVSFSPEMAGKFPYTAMVENYLGGIGTLSFPDGTVQFAENATYPEIVHSPRLEPAKLEAFCENNIEKYQTYFEANAALLIECEPCEPIERFWE